MARRGETMKALGSGILFFRLFQVQKKHPGQDQRKHRQSFPRSLLRIADPRSRQGADEAFQPDLKTPPLTFQTAARP